MRIAC